MSPAKPSARPTTQPSPTRGMPATLSEALKWSAASHPRASVSMLNRRGATAERRGLAEVLASADQAGSRLVGTGVTPGTPVVVALPTSWNWLDAWLGTLAVGGLPVAISPASPLGSAEESFRRLAALLDRIQGRHLVCTPQMLRRLAEISDPSSLPGDLVALIPDQLAALPAAARESSREPDPESTAFLQLTSGTTGESRVVMLPHRAVLHNINAIRAALLQPMARKFEDTSRATAVSWLPLYHDMGLVGSLLSGMLHGLEVRLMPPTGFLGRPATWFRALEADHASVSAAPNFGYQFCVEQLAGTDLSGIDLSRWEAALVGAEMVRPETLAAFARAFEATGFRPDAFRPCYGMAEATLGVTIDQALQGPRTATIPSAGEPRTAAGESTCLGLPVPDTEIRISTPTGDRLPEGRIGEIQVRGPGIFAGYLRDPEATRETLAGEWLRTGDLGFLKAGELYVTGRIKEILVIRGQNLMPHELERLAESEIGGGGVCRAAAFAVERGSEGEQIVLVAEAPTREPEALRQIAVAIRRGVGLTLGMPVADLAFVPSGRLPRTTSGKVRRHQVRQEYIDRRLTRLEY